jgi:hypothetical protein
MMARSWVVSPVLALLLALPAHASAEAPPSGPAPSSGTAATPPRLSFADGEVSFWRAGAEDWAPAKVNTPLAAGDALYAAEGSNAEIELGPRAFVRAGAGTQVGVESLEQDFLQLKVTAGHAAVDLRGTPSRTIEVDTPNAAFTIDHPGSYRFDVDQSRTTFITRQGGRAAFVPAGGASTDVPPDTQLVLEGTDEPHATTSAAPAPDAWDQWNVARTDGHGESQSARYLPRGVSGGEDLDRNGAWRTDPQYGPVWTPAAVSPGWAPYTTGRWIWDPYYGWTWVDDAPWGWAPYHYGRWVNVNGIWGWVPGPVVATPVYAPALVAFLGGPVGVTVGVGFPYVSWVALGFGEPCVPWWGPVGFIGHAWWGGWGGPRVVNNVVIQHNTYVNVRNITVYRNQRVANAVVAVQRDRFGHPGAERVRLDRAEVNRLRPVEGAVGVHPAAASLTPAVGRAVRPPEAVRMRPVVATRPPQNVGPRLRAAGLEPSSVGAPAPRLVSAPSRAERPGGASGGTRRTEHEASPPRGARQGANVGVPTHAVPPAAREAAPPRAPGTAPSAGQQPRGTHGSRPSGGRPESRPERPEHQHGAPQSSTSLPGRTPLAERPPARRGRPEHVAER